MQRAIVIVMLLVGVVPFIHAAIVGWGLAATIRELPIYAACIMLAARNAGKATVWKVIGRTIALCGILASVLIVAAGASSVISSMDAAARLNLGHPIGLHPFLSGKLFPQLALIVILLTAFLPWPNRNCNPQKSEIFS